MASAFAFSGDFVYTSWTCSCLTCSGKYCGRPEPSSSASSSSTRLTSSAVDSSALPSASGCLYAPAAEPSYCIIKAISYLLASFFSSLIVIFLFSRYLQYVTFWESSFNLFFMLISSNSSIFMNKSSNLGTNGFDVLTFFFSLIFDVFTTQFNEGIIADFEDLQVLLWA